MQNFETNDLKVESNAETARQTSPLFVALAWALVSIPLLWGVYETLRKTVALFQYQ